MHRIANLILNVFLLLPFIGLPRPAQAADRAPSAEWVAPAETFLESLQLGLSRIGIPVVMLGIVIVGVWGAATGRTRKTGVPPDRAARQDHSFLRFAANWSKATAATRMMPMMIC